MKSAFIWCIMFLKGREKMENEKKNKKVEVELELEAEVLEKSEVLAKEMGVTREEYISMVLEKVFGKDE